MFLGTNGNQITRYNCRMIWGTIFELNVVIRYPRKDQELNAKKKVITPITDIEAWQNKSDRMRLLVLRY